MRARPRARRGHRAWVGSDPLSLHMGASAMSGRRFAIFNALGALIWAVVTGGVGWVFGGTAQLLLGEIHHFEGWLLLALAVVALAVWAWRWHRAR